MHKIFMHKPLSGEDVFQRFSFVFVYFNLMWSGNFYEIILQARAAALRVIPWSYFRRPYLGQTDGQLTWIFIFEPSVCFIFYQILMMKSR